MKSKVLVLSAIVVLSGCTTTAPATPTEAYLNRYAGAEAVAMNCPAYGGYASVSAMHSDAQKNLTKAKARQRAQGNLTGAAILIGPIEACSAVVNQLAWAGTREPVLKPRRGKPAKPQHHKI